VQPVSGRLPEVVYSAWPENQRGQVEFKTEVQFDQQEYWKVRLILASSAGGGEALSKVEATPPGFGRWDLLLYMLPFLGVSFLWFSASALVQGENTLADADFVARLLHCTGQKGEHIECSASGPRIVR